MLELLELLVNLLDLIVHVGDVLRYWRFWISVGLAIAVAVLMNSQLPWETAKVVASIIAGMGGVTAGVVWECSNRRS